MMDVDAEVNSELIPCLCQLDGLIDLLDFTLLCVSFVQVLLVNMDVLLDPATDNTFRARFTNCFDEEFMFFREMFQSSRHLPFTEKKNYNVPSPRKFVAM